MKNREERIEKFLKEVEQKIAEDFCCKNDHDWEISDRFATTCKRCNKTKYY